MKDIVILGGARTPIGAFLGTSAGNVGSMLSRAHALLRERLAPLDAHGGSSHNGTLPAAPPRRATR